jgi:hypothetical protein
VFIVARGLGMLNNQALLAVMYLSFNLPFVVWILSGFFQGLPVEVEEAGLQTGRRGCRSCAGRGAYGRPRDHRGRGVQPSRPNEFARGVHPHRPQTVRFPWRSPGSSQQGPPADGGHVHEHARDRAHIPCPSVPGRLHRSQAGRRRDPREEARCDLAWRSRVRGGPAHVPACSGDHIGGRQGGPPDPAAGDRAPRLQYAGRSTC